MFPVTVVKRFLNRSVPSIPLPPDIDDSSDSISNPWVLVSDSTSSSRPQSKPTVNSTACQTSANIPQQSTPRSRPRDFSLFEGSALPPPKFRMRSKPPQYQLGGLKVPELQPFASSTSLKTTPTSFEASKLLQASAKSLPSPSKFHCPLRTTQSTEAKETLESNKAKDLLKSIFYEINFSSKLYCEIHDSQYADQHIERIADSLGTGGLLMYIQVWNHWACWCHFHSATPAEAPLSLILDYLHASDLFKKKKNFEPSRTRMTTHIKALRWMALKLDLPILSSLQSQTVSDFLKSKTRIPFERSEATPIPFAVLAAWENRINSDNSEPAEIITLGCFLIATMASLRFRDLLRTKPSSISFKGFILRGISWRTKTSVSGQPWGICCLGIATRPSNGHWIAKFLSTLELAVSKSKEYWGNDWEPDFLLPSWTDSIPFSTPCSYHHGLALIRHFSQCLWHKPPILTPDQALCLSTHSMKTTMLAAAGQLNLNIEQRAKQGHHKMSVQLYSRDDVWPSLFLQRDILMEIGAGWRPLTSQARGAKQPLPEPSFSSPPISEEDLRAIQMITRHKDVKSQSSTTVEQKLGSEQPSKPNGDDSSSSSDSDSSSSSDEDEGFIPSQSSILVINQKSHIVHAALQLNSESITRSRFKIGEKFFEVNCGSSITGAPVKVITEIPTGARICQRKACLAALDHLLTWLSVWEKAISYVPSAHTGRVPTDGGVFALALVYEPRGVYTPKKWMSIFISMMGFPHPTHSVLQFASGQVCRVHQKKRDDSFHYEEQVSPVQRDEFPYWPQWSYSFDRNSIPFVTPQKSSTQISIWEY